MSLCINCQTWTNERIEALIYTYIYILACAFPISPMHACMLSHFSRVWFCVTLWTAAHQAPLSTGFSRQEYWSGLPFLSPNFSNSFLYKITIFFWISFVTVSKISLSVYSCPFPRSRFVCVLVCVSPFLPHFLGQCQRKLEHEDHMGGLQQLYVKSKAFMVHKLVEIEFLIHLWVIESESHSVMSNPLRPHGLYSPWNFSRPEY